MNEPILTSSRVTVESGIDPATSYSTLFWDPQDPVTVKLSTVCPHTLEVVEWRFARDLIDQPLRDDNRPTPLYGRGDLVTVADTDTFKFRLTGTGATCLVIWPIGVVKAWHDATVEACAPWSIEERARYTAGLDAELAALLEGEAS